MAATVSSVWAKPKTWALESEENEDELNQMIMAQPPKPEPPAADFPSLATAATAKPKKKNKAQTLSLAEFTTLGSTPKPGPAPQRLTQDEIRMLPTGPRERTAEELERPRLGGGFRNYGGDNSRVRSSDKGSNRDRDRDMGPSRADEADDWSKSKKFGGFDGGPSERREKVGFFNSSRADEVDNWASKKFVASAPRRETRAGFDSFGGGGGGAEGDSWVRRESNGGGSGRPRLNLQPRTLPVVSTNNNDVVNGGQSVTPTEVKAKGANPFGEARPREEVLAEKGKDWKEIDEKLEAVKIKEVENADKSEGFGRRRGFGIGRPAPDSGDEKTVKSWRKPDAVPSPAESSVDTAVISANTAESSAEDSEKVSEEN
ncbi:Eukaryotic translation initiation factor 4B3 [Bienertia sinuspersici]